MITFDIPSKLVEQIGKISPFTDVETKSPRANVAGPRSAMEKMVESGLLILNPVQFH